MSPEGFIIDVKKKSVFIESCGMTVIIDTRQKGQFPIRKLPASQETVVLPCSEAMISLIPLLLSNNQNFLFYLATQANLILSIYLVNH